jgi:hypothetical protein
MFVSPDFNFIYLTIFIGGILVAVSIPASNVVLRVIGMVIGGIGVLILVIWYPRK